MIKLFVGKKGSGKTKLLIDSANEAIKKVKGHVVYVDYDNSHMFQIDYRVRFISTKEYTIIDDEGFYGFICGIIASNYDIETIFIDGLYKITRKDLLDLSNFFAKLDSLEMKYNVSFIFSVSYDSDELPEFLDKYTTVRLEDELKK
ncbi:hypothetical protein [Alkaliphilus peptidifermentans]|uniref:Twitching motility protein PilT n=1 Tax=Alkaliphilus peptidifermentans DSM 18978 TaxID=1120976 RepID=A0A1G5EJZ6_9FIRM|nr:hypothetical protein [Alkaliphilus peptidifermentans]SCY27272.1 hypothetical protein SAMN03080606_01184 [Alkaliphilus peptidifermentans DSM 18978]